MLSELQSISSMGAFLAFIIFAKGAIFGTFKRRSQVMMAGGFIYNVSSPLSTSLVTSIFYPFTSTFDAKVACGQLSMPPKICPV